MLIVQALEARSGGAAYLVIGVMSSYWVALAVGLGSTRHVRTAAVAGCFALSVWVLVGGALFSEARHPWTRAPFASTGLHVQHRAGIGASVEVGEPRLERPVPASFVRATRLSDGDERSFLVKPVLGERSVFVPLRITRGDVVETFVYELVMDSERQVHATLLSDGRLELRRGAEGPLGFPFFADEVVALVAPVEG